MQKQLEYHLQNRTYSQKLSIFTHEMLKSSFNIQKSHQKHLKALKKYSLHLLFSMFTGLFCAFYNIVTMNSTNQ
jgi:hypothetical protein